MSALLPDAPVRLLPKKRPRRIISNISVSRKFLRRTGKEMDPLTFRIMCHGLTYPTGWSVKRCMAETGYSRNVIYRHLHKLLDTGYVEIVRHPSKKRNGYRFIAEPGAKQKGDIQ